MKTEKPKTRDEANAIAALLTKCNSPKQFASLLHTDLLKLPLLCLPEQYSMFKVPKSNGKFRLIEAPKKELKAIQQRLNLLLQCYYNTIRPACSYGFILNMPDTKKKHQKNILNNAKTHKKSRYLVNLDLKDFFHQITDTKLKQAFKAHNKLHEDVVEWIVKIGCLKNRLPMGAPTSPVLSNIAMMELDYALLQLAEKYALTYTRFADDITFSGKRKIHTQHYVHIHALLQDNGFHVNTNKFKLSKPGEIKEVTGICIHKNKLRVSDTFVKEIRSDIAYFKKINRFRQDYEILYANAAHSNTLKFTRQSIAGKINFAGYVHGFKSKLYKELMHYFNISKQMPAGVSATNYYYFIKGAI